jgi:hypothetical protein
VRRRHCAWPLPRTPRWSPRRWPEPRDERLGTGLAVGDDLVGFLHCIGAGLLRTFGSFLGLGVGLRRTCLSLFDELLVLCLSLFVALLALGLGILALVRKFDVEVVFGLLRRLIAGLRRLEQLIGLCLSGCDDLFCFGLGLGTQIRSFLLSGRPQFGELEIKALASLLGESGIRFLGLVGLAFGGCAELGCAFLSGFDRLFGAQFGRGSDRIGFRARIGQCVVALGVHPSASGRRLGAGLVPNRLGIGIGLSQGLAGLRLGDLEKMVDAASGRPCRLCIVVGSLLQLCFGFGELTCDLQLRPICIDDLTARIGQGLADRLDLGAQLLQSRIDFTLLVAAHRCAEFFGGRH